LLRSKGHETVIFDNMTNGHSDAVGDTKLIVGDLRNRNDINEALQSDSFDAVIHFAALALAGESMKEPYEYYHNNIDGGLNLLEAMRTVGCNKIIFSSTGSCKCCLASFFEIISPKLSYKGCVTSCAGFCF